MTQFDAIRALQEELTGLSDVLRTLRVRERYAEERMGQAEAELNAIRKLTGFAVVETERKRAVLRRLQEEKESTGEAS